MKANIGIEKDLTKEKYWIVINDHIYIRIDKLTAVELAKSLNIKSFLKELKGEV